MNNFCTDLKKSLITASLVGLVIAVNSSVNAIPSINILDDARFYVGAGLGYNQYNLSKDFKNKIEQLPNKGSVKDQSSDLLIPILGVKFQDNYGLELGYQYQYKLKFSGLNSGHLQIRNSYLDVMGHMPVENHLDLIGGLGIGYANLKEKSSLLAMGSGNKYNKFGVRAKIGAQYYLNTNCSVRGLFGYQRAGDNSGKQSIKSIQYAHVDFIYLI